MVMEGEYDSLVSITVLHSITTSVIHEVNKGACEHERLVTEVVSSQSCFHVTKL